MQTVPCPHCEQPVRPTATFCLACDRPIVDTERGLSVAAPAAVPPRRRVLALGVAAASVLGLAGAAYGGFRVYQDARTASAGATTNEVRHALELVVSAQRGHAHSCRALAPLVAASTPTTLAECRAIVGDDPGAHLRDVTIAAPHLDRYRGTTHVVLVVEDADGRRRVDEVVHLVEREQQWRMVWDGTPVAPPRTT